jgi:hypothetical protein
MRKINEISGFAILFFLICAMGFYEGNLQRFLLSIVALIIGLHIAINKIMMLRPKKRGYFLRG